MSNHPESTQDKRARRRVAYRTSVIVAIVLAVLTGIEYFVALSTSSAIIMFLIALLKAYAVVVYFMHVARLWTPEGEH